MRAEMKQDGTLWITPETECEAYALEQWRAVRPTRRRMWVGEYAPPAGWEPLTAGTGVTIRDHVPWSPAVNVPLGSTITGTTVGYGGFGTPTNTQECG